MRYILVILIAMSVTNILTSEFIFEPVRNLWEKVFSRYEKLQYLISCPVCSGFWVGLFIGALFLNNWFLILSVPFVTSLMMKLLVIFENRM